jgi:peptide chain release factor
MNLNEVPPVTPAKFQDLKDRIARLGLDLRQVEESFVKGSGKGGQKINKTSNAVMLKYAPMGLVVKCQRERQRSINRFLALRTLVEKIERRMRSAGTL